MKLIVDDEGSKNGEITDEKISKITAILLAAALVLCDNNAVYALDNSVNQTFEQIR